MAQIKKVFADEIIPSIPDRNANRIFIIESQYKEICLNIRNLKIILSYDEMEKWQELFIKAEEEYKKRNKITYEL